MPATYAHYKFGKEVYRNLPADIKTIVKENAPAYWLGLHGPDLLFYYRPYSKNRINQKGVAMHREIAAEFFRKGRSIYQKRPSYVLLSYLGGFLCHFMLDSECHPYIGSYMAEHGVGHLELETDFDRQLLEDDGHDPVRHNCTRHLIRDLDTEEAIASVLEVTPDEVDACILGFQRTIHFFQCPSRAKARFLQSFFTSIGQGKGLAGLVMTGRPNPKCKEGVRVLEEKLHAAAAPTAAEIGSYVRGIEGKEALSGRLSRDYE